MGPRRGFPRPIRKRMLATRRRRRPDARACANRCCCALGVTINGLVILSETPMPWNPEHTNPPGGLANYYRVNVVGGPGAFVLEAKDFNSFGLAIIKKLIAEIADATPPR